MGTLTSLNALSFSQSADNAESVYGEDVNSLLAQSQLSAAELINKLNLLSSKLPGGDPNITTIAGLVTALS